MKRLLLAASLALLASPARAESPKWGSFAFSLSWYRPDIDSEFAGRTTPGGLPVAPYAASFGNSNQIMFQGVFSKSLWITQVGTLDLGVGAGYWGVKGQGIQATNPTVQGDTTSMGIVPISLVATYRFDWFVESLKVPLAPYLRASLLDYVWWVNGGSGSTASAITTSGTVVKGSGSTFGYSFAAGLGLDLNFFDPKLAREFDNEVGVNHTMFYGEVSKSWVNDFGSSKSWDLSSVGVMWTIGLLFVF